MLKLFKSSFALLPVAIILVFMIALRIDVIYNNFSINLWEGNLAPFSKLVVYGTGENLLTNPIFNAIISLFFVFLQSGIILSIFGFFKNKELKNFLPAWLFILLMHLNPVQVFLSPQLIAFTFILWLFRTLIKYTMNSNNKTALFEMGLLLGISSLFWMPSVFFLIFVLYFLNKKLLLSIKAFLSIFFSFFVPYVYVLTYYVLTDNFALENIFTSIQFNSFQFSMINLKSSLSSVLVFVLLLFSFFSLAQFLQKQVQEIKDLFSLIIVFIINTIIVFLFQDKFIFLSLIFVLFPISVFLSIFFDRIKRKALAEFVHLALLLTIIVNFMFFT